MLVAEPMMGNRGQTFEGLALRDATRFGRNPHMIKVSLTSMAAAVGGLALSLAAGAGVASAAPDLGPAVNTTCSYPQLVSALNAQGPEAGAHSTNRRCCRLDCVSSSPQIRPNGSKWRKTCWLRRRLRHSWDRWNRRFSPATTSERDRARVCSSRPILCLQSAEGLESI